MRNKELLSSFEQIPFGSFQKHHPGLVFLSHSEVPGAQALEAFLTERQGGFGSGVAVRPASRVCGVGRPCHQRRADPGPWPGRLMPGWTAAPAGVLTPAVRGRVESPRSGTPRMGRGEPRVWSWPGRLREERGRPRAAWCWRRASLCGLQPRPQAGRPSCRSRPTPLSWLSCPGFRPELWALSCGVTPLHNKGASHCGFPLE